MNAMLNSTDYDNLFTAEDRIRIVLRGLSGSIGISELCRREGLPTWLYYDWCMKFLEAGKAGLRADEQRAAASQTEYTRPARVIHLGSAV